MSVRPEVSAEAAKDSYIDRPATDVDTQTVTLGGVQYQVFAYKDDPKTGFHGTAYRNINTDDIIVSYRGTDPDLLHHTTTMGQDIVVDFKMVRDKANTQEAAASEFTQYVIDKAQKQGISKDHISVAGHSLGGTLAELEAAKFGLHGVTFNAYGAVDLKYHVPEGGQAVTNYVMAGDPVSAASRHFGQTVTLASVADADAAKSARYIDAQPGSPPPNPLLAMRPGDHGLGNFTGPNGALANMAQFQKNYEDHKAAFDHARGDLYREREELSQVLSNPGSRNLLTTYAMLPPHIQQQLAEVQQRVVDAPIDNMFLHNGAVEGAKHGLDQAGVALCAGGEGVQHAANSTAQDIRAAGHVMQQRADAVSHGAHAFAPFDPIAAEGVVLGAKAAGYVARGNAEVYAGASELAGHVAHASTQWAADQTKVAKSVVEGGAHGGADVVKGAVHVSEAGIAMGADVAIEATRGAYRAGQAGGLAYEAGRQAVSHGIESGTHAVEQAYERVSNLVHPSDTPRPMSRLPSCRSRRLCSTIRRTPTTPCSGRHRRRCMRWMCSTAARLISAATTLPPP